MDISQNYNKGIGRTKGIRGKFVGISHYDRDPIITACNLNSTESKVFILVYNYYCSQEKPLNTTTLFY